MEIALVATSSALLTIAVAISLVVLSFKLSDAKDAAAASAVRVAQLEGEAAIAKSTIDTRTNEANSERTRANALDDALGKAEQELESDPRGALDRLLARWRVVVPNVPASTAGAAAIGGAGAMSPPAATAAPADARDGLLKPGE